MTITSISGFGGIQSQQTQRTNARLQAAIASLVSGTRLTQASTDVAALSIASQLQAQTSGLKQISSNLAQVSSLTQVADGGAEQIGAVIQQLQSLASQAQSPTLNPENRKQLNEQFQELTRSIDSIVNGTTFNNQKLLDGTQTLSLDQVLDSEVGDSTQIDNLSRGALLGDLDILSAESASQAFAALGDALNQVTGVRAGLGAFQQSIEFASANVDTALFNQEAARSSIEDTDFLAAATELSQANFQRNAEIALAAQGNRITPAILQLIG